MLNSVTRTSTVGKKVLYVEKAGWEFHENSIWRYFMKISYWSVYINLKKKKYCLCHQYIICIVQHVTIYYQQQKIVPYRTVMTFESIEYWLAVAQKWITIRMQLQLVAVYLLCENNLHGDQHFSPWNASTFWGRMRKQPTLKALSTEISIHLFSRSDAFQLDCLLNFYIKKTWLKVEGTYHTYRSHLLFVLYISNRKYLLLIIQEDHAVLAKLGKTKKILQNTECW